MALLGSSARKTRKAKLNEPIPSLFNLVQDFVMICNAHGMHNINERSMVHAAMYTT
jgi:hypothetical protein